MKFKSAQPLGGYSTLIQKYRQLQRDYERLHSHSMHMILENTMLTDTDSPAANGLEDYFGKGENSCFAVLLICHEDPGAAGERGHEIFETIFDQFEKHLGQYARLVFFNSNSPRGIGCLVEQDNLTRDDVALLGPQLGAEMAELCQQALEAVRELGNIKARCYISDLEFGTGNIKKLFRNAVVTHDHSYETEKPVTTSYDLRASFGDAVSSDINLSALERQYLNFVIGKRFFEAVTVFDTIIDYTISTSMPTLEHTVSSIFMRLETALALCGIEDTTVVPEIGEVFKSIIKARDFGEVRDCVHDCFAMLEDNFAESDSQLKITKALEYIDENYSQPSMGAALICREFRFSASYLSRLFKINLGVSVVDYIHSVRIERAKALLVKDDETIDNIAELVGFTNRWTLIRVFKKLEGITPGAYRQITDNR